MITLDQKKDKPAPPTVNFLGYHCQVIKGYYNEGHRRISLELITVEKGEPVAVASINMPHTPMNPDEIFIKDYSENEGIAKILMDAKIIGPPLAEIATGYVLVRKHKLLI